MKKLFALLLAALLLLSLVACNGDDPAQTAGGTNPLQPTYAETKNPLTSFSINYTKSAEDTTSIVVTANDDLFSDSEEKVHVDYSGKTTQSGDFNATVLHGITDALKKTDLASLNGKDTLEEGASSGSLYATYEDGTILSVTFNGSVPEAFVTGFETMDAFFLDLFAASQTATEPQ